MKQHSLRASAAGAAYTTSKHAVIGLAKSSAFLYHKKGIRVNAEDSSNITGVVLASDGGWSAI